MPVDGALVSKIENAALWAWPPRETAMLRGWLLRAGGGSSRRLNSAATLDFDGDDLHSAMGAVEQWYAARDVPACFHLTDMARPEELDAALAARGYGSLTPTHVMTTAISTIDGPRHDVELETRPTALVMNALADPHWTAEIRRDRAAVLARIRRPHVFCVATIDGAAMAAGFCVVEGDLAGIFSMRTQVTMRRRGLARSVLGRLAQWARGMGAETFYLQVEKDNAPAVGLYRSLGFTHAYGYHYRQMGEGKA